MTISVTMIRLVHDAYVGDNQLIAYFDLRLEGVADIKGCALVQTKNHGLSVWSPPCERKHNEPERGIKFVGQMRKAVTGIAKRSYDDFLKSKAANTVTLSAAVALVQEIERRDAA